jgi:hypothetical protein
LKIRLNIKKDLEMAFKIKEKQSEKIDKKRFL